MLNVISGLLGVGGGAPASTTSYESISTVTVGAGGSSSITFSSIPSTFKHLQIRGIVSSVSTNDIGALTTFNADSGSNYGSHYLYGTGSAVGASADTPRSNVYIASNIYPSYFSSVVCDILDYQDTNKYKTIRSLTGGDRNGAGLIWLFSGAWRSTSAINSIQITSSTNSFAQYSQFALYGIKG